MELSPKGGFEATGAGTEGLYTERSRPLDGHGSEKGAKTVIASDGRGKILIQNREGKENAKKHTNSPYFLRISFRLGLRQRR